MFILSCLIRIGNYEFTSAHDIVIESAWNELADVASIHVPSRLQNKARELEGEFKPGDKVSIQLAYEGYPVKTEFEGYVKRIHPNDPLQIDCEDEIYLLRKKTIRKAWKTPVTLREIVDEIVSGTGIKISGKLPLVNFKKFYINDENGAAALQKLKDEYRFSAYVKNRVLYVGLSHFDLQGYVNFDLSRNVIESNLEYFTKENVSLNVTAIGYTKDNKKITVKVGDSESDSEKRTLVYFNIENQVQLQTLAFEDLNKLKYSGYKGSVTSFLLPYAEHSMIANFTDPDYPERNGAYFIDKVVTKFGSQGARRVVTVGRKI